MIELTLPYPPTANNLHAVVGGRKVLSAAGRAYHGEVAALVLAAGRPRMPPGRYAALLVAMPPDARRRDLGNVEKAAIDAAVRAGVLADDSLIDVLALVRGPKVPGGRVTVRLWTLDELGGCPLCAGDPGWPRPEGADGRGEA